MKRSTWDLFAIVAVMVPSVVGLLLYRQQSRQVARIEEAIEAGEDQTIRLRIDLADVKATLRFPTVTPPPVWGMLLTYPTRICPTKTPTSTPTPAMDAIIRHLVAGSIALLCGNPTAEEIDVGVKCILSRHRSTPERLETSLEMTIGIADGEARSVCRARARRETWAARPTSTCTPSEDR